MNATLSSFNINNTTDYYSHSPKSSKVIHVT